MTTAFAAYFPRPVPKEACPGCEHPPGVHGYYGCYASREAGWLVASLYTTEDGDEHPQGFCACEAKGDNTNDYPAPEEF